MDKRKEEIVEIAIKRFSHYGFGKTTMNEIAEDLGITKANLYYYYPDKSALIKDVICYVSQVLNEKESKLLDSYSGDFLGTLFALLELRAEHMRKYYIFYINENLDWIKGAELTAFFKKINDKDFELLKALFHKAVDSGVLLLKNVDESVETFIDIVRGMSFYHTAQDIISGIPNPDNVDKIVTSQKRAIQLIFEERIVTNK